MLDKKRFELFYLGKSIFAQYGPQIARGDTVDDLWLTQQTSLVKSARDRPWIELSRWLFLAEVSQYGPAEL